MTITNPPLCRTCAHLRVLPGAVPRNACAWAGAPRTLDVVTGAVRLPGAGATRARGAPCGEGAAGWARAGLWRRYLTWLGLF